MRKQYRFEKIQKIIVVSAFGIDRKESASQRIFSLIKGLSENGFIVDFITFKYEEGIINDEISKLCNIIYIRPSLLSSIVRKIINTFKKGKSHGKPGFFESRDSVFWSLINFFFTKGHIVPLIKSFVATVKAISGQKMKDPVIILTSTPPPSYHIIGLITKFIFRKRIIWIADYQDPISFSPFIKSTNNLLFRMIDKLVWRYCDLSITPFKVLKDYLEKVQERLGIVNKNIFFLPKGIEMQTSTFGSKINHNYKIIYGGSLYSAQLPGIYALFEALKALPDFSFVYAGYSAETLMNISSQYGLQRVKIHKTVPYEEFNRLVIEADIILVLSTFFKEATFFGGKLYEFLGFDKPILVIAPKNEEIEELSYEAGGIYISDANPENIKQTLERIAEDLKKKKNFRKSEFYVKYSHSALAKELTELILKNQNP
ncbi:MAG: hypothetical protein N3E37_04815 [Candidatus Micrarchaeota archaeon]|nr:hypothetical protein [Candidatus Micrarchaeota archaeon]